MQTILCPEPVVQRIPRSSSVRLPLYSTILLYHNFTIWVKIEYLKLKGHRNIDKPKCLLVIVRAVSWKVEGDKERSDLRDNRKSQSMSGRTTIRTTQHTPNLHTPSVHPETTYGSGSLSLFQSPKPRTLVRNKSRERRILTPSLRDPKSTITVEITPEQYHLLYNVSSTDQLSFTSCVAPETTTTVPLPPTPPETQTIQTKPQYRDGEGLPHWILFGELKKSGVKGVSARPVFNNSFLYIQAHTYKVH